MKIFFHVMGTRGDVHPMLALAVEAGRRGHESLVCASPDFGPDAADVGVDFVGVGGPSDELLQKRNDLRMHVEQVRLQVRRVVEAAAGAQLVVGTGVPLVGPTAAEVNGCPYRYIGQAPEFVESNDFVTPLFPIKRLPLFARTAVNAGFNAFWTLLYGPPLAGERKRLGLTSAWGDSLEPFRGDPPMILACDEALAAMPEHPAIKAVQTAAIQLAPVRGLSERASAFLDQRGPAVYLGFGSMQSTHSDDGSMLAEAIHRATGSPVLVRAGNGSEAEDPDWLLRVDDEPHAHLFPRCAAVVHHGGAGTVTTAARCGVRQIIVPHLADQFCWAGRVEKLGVGERLSRRRNPDELARTVGRVLSSSSLAARALDLSEAIGSPDGAGLTLDALLG